jgi:hypothetical protein
VVSFKTDLVPILKTQCATCHLMGTEAGNIALHPGAAYANLVNVSSVEAPELLRVRPGRPEASYLMLKLEGTHLDAGGSGVRMPFGAPPLDDDTLGLFRIWIAAGAENN